MSGTRPTVAFRLSQEELWRVEAVATQLGTDMTSALRTLIAAGLNSPQLETYAAAYQHGLRAAWLWHSARFNEMMRSISALGNAQIPQGIPGAPTPAPPFQR